MIFNKIDSKLVIKKKIREKGLSTNYTNLHELLFLAIKKLVKISVIGFAELRFATVRGPKKIHPNPRTKKQVFYLDNFLEL